MYGLIAFMALAVLALLALNILQLIFGYRERGKLLDRIQARSLGEFKATEAKEAKKPDEKEPVKRHEPV
jgi:hypothetical protein